MTRFATNTLKTLVDLIVLGLALVLSTLLRFDWNVPSHEWQHLLQVLPYVVALQYLCLATFAVHRFAWAYIGLREVTRVFYAMAVATAILLAVRLLAHPLALRVPAFMHAVISIGIILIDFVLGFSAIVAIRALRRVVAERAGKASHTDAKQVEHGAVRTLLVGAGQAGVMVAREIAGHPDLAIEPVGFVDDNTSKVGTIIHGITVLGTTHQLGEICRKTSAKQVLITIADASGKDLRRIVKLCEQAALPMKIIPGVHEIVGGQVNLSRLRDIAIEDLLRREPVTLEESEISATVRDQVVLVTGAGGSIGSELCRQLCRFAPKQLLLVERAENNLFEIHRELLASHPSVEIVPLIADVCDGRRIDSILGRHRPTLVLHAAAHKHVPLMEWNPCEAVKNNVFGTRTLADLAEKHAVSRFVMISTDKAVNPSSVMGASKRLGEIYLQALSRRSKTRFINVRFGNVLGSAGSVVPIFKQQIARGGPITITHPDMTRYFMTIPEASQLVLQAATMGSGGEIFILDMGEPVKIVDLASDLITLSGLKPGEDIEIQFTGAREGEKLFEELSLEHENADKTRHPKIFVGKLSPVPWPHIESALLALAEAIDSDSQASVLRHLARAVPEFQRVQISPQSVQPASVGREQQEAVALGSQLSPVR